MINWFDLTKVEQKKLRIEFSKKRSVTDLRIPLYTLSIFFFVIFLIPLFCRISEVYEPDTYNRSLLFLGTLFAISFLSAILNSLLVSKNEKEFTKWLKSRNIDK